MVLIRKLEIKMYKERWRKNKEPPQRNDEENEIYVLLKCNGTQKWQEKFWNNKRLHVNEQIAHKKIITCTKITELKKKKTSLQIKVLVRKLSRKNGELSIINRNTFCIEKIT